MTAVGSAALTGAVEQCAGWTPVCEFRLLQPERGVAALVGGVPIAVFRTHDDALYAIDNVDPCSGASVLSRGIVGSRDGAPTVASPMHKQAFDLRTGECLDQPGAAVRTYPVRCRDGVVEVGWPAVAGRVGMGQAGFEPAGVDPVRVDQGGAEQRAAGRVEAGKQG